MSNPFVTPWTVAHQAPLSMGFSRQEYWSGLPFSLPRDLLDPGIDTCVSWLPFIGRQILYHWVTWEALILCICTNTYLHICIFVYIYIYIYTSLQIHIYAYRISLVAQTLKNLRAMQEVWVWPLGQEDSLEKAMGTHSSILGWRTSWTEEPGGLQSRGSQRIRHDWLTNPSLSAFIHLYKYIYLYIYTHLCISGYIQGFPGSSANKESACKAGDPGWLPGSKNPLEKG